MASHVKMPRLAVQFQAAVLELLLLAVLDTGPGWPEILQTLDPAGTLDNVLGPLVDGAGVVLVAAGAVQAAGTVIPLGAAAANFRHRTINQAWPALGRAVISVLDLVTQQPDLAHPFLDEVIFSLFAEDTRRGKFVERLMWRFYLPWALAGARAFLKTPNGYRYDWIEGDPGPPARVSGGESKSIVYFYHWRPGPHTDGTYTHYLFIVADIKFGKNPILPVPGPGVQLGMLTLTVLSRWRRRMAVFRVPRASLARPGPWPPGPGPKPDPSYLWIPPDPKRKKWNITVGGKNIGRYRNPGGAQYPLPRAPAFLTPEHEDRAIAFTQRLITGALGPPGARIVTHPGQRLPDLF